MSEHPRRTVAAMFYCTLWAVGTVACAVGYFAFRVAPGQPTFRDSVAFAGLGLLFSICGLCLLGGSGLALYRITSATVRAAFPHIEPEP